MSEQSTNLEENWNYDAILVHIGSTGKFQKIIWLALCISIIFSGSNVTSVVFIDAVPRYRCLVEGCQNATATELQTTWLNKSSLNEQQNACFRYNQTDTQCQPYEADETNSTAVLKCDQWLYDTSMFESTIVTEFNVVCDDEWRYNLVDTAFMAGMFFGGVSLVYISDIFGRRPALTISCFFLACFMTASAFVSDITTFIVFRFFGGIFYEAIFAISFVWAVEVTSTERRIIIGFLVQTFFTFGECFVGLVAYYIRDWRKLQFVISVPIFGVAIISWFLPESIRWLLSVKQYDRARQVVVRVSKMNGATAPLHLTITPDHDAETRSRPEQKQQRINEKSTEHLWKILLIPSLRQRVLILFFAWNACVISFYGIGFSIHSLPGNFFVNYQLMMLIEVPAYVFGAFIADKGGRRITISGSLVISGIACLCIGLTPEDPPVYRIILALFGKLFASFSFGGLYLFTSELFPTSVRTSVIGLCSTIGRLGGVVVPIAANEGAKIDPAMPFVIFAVNNIISGLLCFLLPETHNIPLPSSMQEADEIKSKRLRCCN